MSAAPAFKLLAYELPKDIRDLIYQPNKNFSIVLKIYHKLKALDEFYNLSCAYIADSIPIFIKYHMMNKIIKKCSVSAHNLFMRNRGDPYCSYEVLRNDVGYYVYIDMIKTSFRTWPTTHNQFVVSLGEAPDINLFKLLLKTNMCTAFRCLRYFITDYKKHHLTAKIVKYHILKYGEAIRDHSQPMTSHTLRIYNNKCDITKVITTNYDFTKCQLSCVSDIKTYTNEKLIYNLTKLILAKFTTRNMTKLIMYHA